ncbi:Uncharacterized protein SCF082_LOCUS35143, partial [Durusdinium trenchii]
MVRDGQRIRFVCRAAVLILLLAGLLAVACWGPDVRERLRFAAVYRQTQAEVETIESRRPEGIPERIWQHECWWAGIAVANVCFSLDNVPLTRMEQFHNDVVHRLESEEPLSLEFFDWLWVELASLSPTGADYVQRIGAVYREDSGSLRQSLMSDATE